MMMNNVTHALQPLDPASIKVRGQRLAELPTDLYIPPDAMAVLLETFEGPLDLLLYLIRQHDLDILDIPMMTISAQYIQYIDLMQRFEITLAAEYLLMAAMLTEIKSRLLLPRPAIEVEEGEDPRAELVRRLQEYERFKHGADCLDRLPRLYRDHYPVCGVEVKYTAVKPLPKPDLSALIAALQAVMVRAEQHAQHQISHETLSIRGRMSDILSQLQNSQGALNFVELCQAKEGRLGVVVTLVAILELAKSHLLDIVQLSPTAPIHVQQVTSAEAAE